MSLAGYVNPVRVTSSVFAAVTVISLEAIEGEPSSNVVILYPKDG